MSEPKDKRKFCTPMQETNSPFLPTEEATHKPIRVGFVLLEHFSMMAFTAAVDALVTANLVSPTPLFRFTTYGIDSRTAKSDLGISISTNGWLEPLQTEGDDRLDILIVCGGFRCALSEHPLLTAKLKAAARQKTILGALWNGAVALAYAGLLDGRECALHPDNHAFMNERFAKVKVSKRVLVVENDRATSAGPSSALEMMLLLIKGIQEIQGKNTVRAIREILSCDQAAENRDTELVQITDDPSFPDILRTLLQIMSANIEEPLSVDELSSFAEISRRRIERLFQTHLDTSPSRFYLELRITHARRLLLQGQDSIASIAVASGFVSSTHFSHCFKDYFGLSPSQARQQRSD